MPVLLIGGPGYVGGLVAPLLLQQFTLRIFDLRPPVSGSGYVHGDATDYPALLAAMADVDAIVHCAMGPVDRAEADVAAAAPRSTTAMISRHSWCPATISAAGGVIGR